MDLLKLLKYQNVSFQLPASSGALLAYYCRGQKLVEPNEFVINSLMHFIQYNSKDIKRGDISEVVPCPFISFNFTLPRILLSKMLLLSFKAKVSFSAILNEALVHSLPMLVEIEQVMTNKEAIHG